MTQTSVCLIYYKLFSQINIYLSDFVITDSGFLRFHQHKLQHLMGEVNMWPQFSPLTITAIVTKATAKMLVATMAMVTLEMATMGMVPMGLVIQAIVTPAMAIAAMATLVMVIRVMDTMVTDTTTMNTMQMVSLHGDACFPQLP